MALNDYQMSFSGLTFGKGTGVGIETIQGFEDWEAALGDSPVPRQWGDIPGQHTVESKDIVLELSTRTDESLNTILDTFHPTDLDDESQMLVIREPHHADHFVFARSIGRYVPKNPGTKFKKMATVRLRAADPRIYSVAQVAEATGIFVNAVGGFDYGLDYGKDYTGAASQNILSLPNNGNSKAYPHVKIFGPQDGNTLTGATITNDTTGKAADFDFTTPLLATDVFTADMRRIITTAPGDVPYVALGATNRYGDWQLPREPFYLVPGENIIRLEVDGTTTDALCVLSYRHTSL